MTHLRVVLIVFAVLSEMHQFVLVNRATWAFRPNADPSVHLTRNALRLKLASTLNVRILVPVLVAETLNAASSTTIPYVSVLPDGLEMQ